MEVEFKEKTYEKYFFKEIAGKARATYSPDQVDESLLGFDDAFLIHHSTALRYLRQIRRNANLKVGGVTLQDLSVFTKRLERRLPPFRFNLFVQYKRPVHLYSKSAGQWKNWKQPYYRYAVTHHQQKILELIDQKSKKRAATIYASPAFWRHEDMWTFADTNRVIANSNIATARKLNQHDHYSYAKAGGKGKGHSETAEIQSEALENIFLAGLEGERLTFGEHIQQAATMVKESVQETLPGWPGVAHLSPDENQGDLSTFEALDLLERFSYQFEISYYAIA